MLSGIEGRYGDVAMKIVGQRDEDDIEPRIGQGVRQSRRRLRSPAKQHRHLFQPLRTLVDHPGDFDSRQALRQLGQRSSSVAQAHDRATQKTRRREPTGYSGCPAASCQHPGRVGPAILVGIGSIGGRKA